MTPAALERAFEVYIAEIERCVRTKCYWALLHLLVILPDICASLEADDGEADGRRYREWCERYFPGDKAFTPEDRYAIRCALLHQGRTIPDRGQYGSFSFVPPTETGDVFHRISTDFGAGTKPNFTIDVSKMAEETKEATRRWFNDLQQLEKSDHLKNVQRYLPLLVRMGQKTIPGFEGRQIYTVSSTGSITSS
jgi:hypothetical protein